MKKLILFPLLLLSLFLSSCFVPYAAKNQLKLHEKLSEPKTKVAVLPFTLNTEKNNGFLKVDSKVTNSFLNSVWKKNKVKIAHKDKVLEQIISSKTKYFEMNPDMKDLTNKPNLKKISKIGTALNCDVVFIGTVRQNTFSYQDGIFGTKIMAKSRLYKIGVQMMAVDINTGNILACDYINNELAVKTKFFSFTGKVSDENLEKIEDIMLTKCGFALSYYAPMPEKRTDGGAIALQTGAALLNIFAGTDFNVNTYITDETWKMYPADYFDKNFAYTQQEIKNIKNQ